ncbi:Uncharacterized ABC transporter ATP-binding protein YvrO [[Clostridium] ultunense Esp]|nr:Uncharacterized ABC transporter ATP-binding protein YvrO [[Clostridium] ultunense Esp]
MTNLVKVENLEKTYSGDGVSTRALSYVNVTFRKGEFTAIISPSGSGKSTLLSLIGTLDQPSSGTIYFDDLEVSRLRGKKLADFRFETIGFVFQQFHLLPTLTAIENVMAPLIGRSVSFKKRERAEELLELVGLSHKHRALPSQLSGGEQQRVAVARALVNHPEWLLADEPTGNLDTKNGEIIFNLLCRLREEQGCGIIFVTHDSKLASRADRIVEMRDGQIIEER